MIGLSSSYFAFFGKNIYDSVKGVFGFGFDTVELGAGHSPEKNAFETVKRIKKEFPEKNYTVHALFPPLEERFWFNASLGLTKVNEKVVENLFKTAHMVEASAVTIHPGFKYDVGWKGLGNKMNYPVPKEAIPDEKAWSNLFRLVEKCLKLAEENSCSFGVEATTDHAVKPLVCSKEEFERIFKQFPNLGLLLDTGHVMAMGKLDEFLDNFNKKVMQLHLHISDPKLSKTLGDQHSPVTSEKELEPLNAIKQLKEIPIIFEHSTNVNSAQILNEKRILESFLKKKF